MTRTARDIAVVFAVVVLLWLVAPLLMHKTGADRGDFQPNCANAANC